ncbi:glycosyltransferase family 2 protein [Pedobacter lithocola]|uniref:Glycosyltransferase family 2 protein n=1 Tax=Pedobacter lithocola TaxID=1908239 RepID=A0ABV8PBH2_9SPHI
MITYAEISIIICVYNEECFLKALRSIKNNYCYNKIEVIIINDCSHNPITNRLLHWLQKKTKVIIKRTDKNIGLSGARNLGISIATSPYIIPLDADDILPPYAVDLILKTFKSQINVDFIYGDYLKNDVEKNTHIHVSNAVISTQSSLNIFALLNNWTLLGSSPFKKETWFRIKGYSLEYSNNVQDVDFWLKALKNGMKGFYVNKILYIWNISEKGMNSTYNRKYNYYLLQDHLEFYSLYYNKNILINKIVNGLYSNHEFLELIKFYMQHFWSVKLINHLKVVYIPVLIIKSLKYNKSIVK